MCPSSRSWPLKSNRDTGQNIGVVSQWVVVRDRGPDEPHVDSAHLARMVVFGCACPVSILRVVGRLTYRFADTLPAVGQDQVRWTESCFSRTPLACAIVASTGLLWVVFLA
jgi:hypothetical protein